MNLKFRSSRQTLITLTGIFLLSASLNCGGYNTEQHRVNATQARDVLQDVLSSWKSGEKPSDWEKKAPPVFVQDLEWASGVKLVSFEIQGEGKPLDSNLHCPVRMTVQYPQSGQTEKLVTYMVTTSPKLFVSRSMGP